MTARVIKESYEGGQADVDVTAVRGQDYVSLLAFEAGADSGSLLYFTPTEAAELVAALNAAIVEAAQAPATVADALARARAELLGNSTLVTDADERRQLADDMVLADRAIGTPVAAAPTDGTWFPVTDATGAKSEARVVDFDDDTGLFTLEFADGERCDLSRDRLAGIYSPANRQVTA